MGDNWPASKMLFTLLLIIGIVIVGVRSGRQAPEPVADYQAIIDAKAKAQNTNQTSPNPAKIDENKQQDSYYQQLPRSILLKLAERGDRRASAELNQRQADKPELSTSAD
ncbi:MAG: hypothetical protein OIF35_01340 [Cellvibrionaceae bacterium]|nr:hypothetical protein [Cellvibrionaceae bacterium]